MRLWTVHPCYLDRQGLLALWREALLAQKVLQGNTRGYRHHPQLTRFRATLDPVAAIGRYLEEIYQEAAWRGYHFNASKITPCRLDGRIPETRGQLLYEWKHLLRKLQARDPVRFAAQQGIEIPLCHPLFEIVAGDVQPWEWSEITG